MIFISIMSFGLVRQVGPWTETKQDTRFQSFDQHRNYRIDPMLQGAPAAPAKASFLVERSVIDKRPFMPFRRTNNFRVAVNPYGTKPSLGDPYTGEMGAGGRTLGAAPSKNYPGERMNPIDQKQTKFEGTLVKEEDGFPGVEPLADPVLSLPRRVMDSVNSVIVRTGGAAVNNAPYMIDLLNSALSFIGNNGAIEGLIHAAADPQIAATLSQAIAYQQSLRRLVQDTIVNPGARNLGTQIQRLLTSSSPEVEAYRPAPMVQEYLDHLSQTRTATTNSFVHMVIALVQLFAMNHAIRNRGAQRVDGFVRQQVARIDQVAANAGRGLVGGAIRSLRNVPTQ
jgi:hypothetical protein